MQNMEPIQNVQNIDARRLPMTVTRSNDVEGVQRRRSDIAPRPPEKPRDSPKFSNYSEEKGFASIDYGKKQSSAVALCVVNFIILRILQGTNI